MSRGPTFIKMRHCLRSLQEYSSQVKESIEGKFKINDHDKVHIELCVDETGTLGKDKEFAIGGIYVIVKNDNDTPNAINEILRQSVNLPPIIG